MLHSDSLGCWTEPEAAAPRYLAERAGHVGAFFAERGDATGALGNREGCVWDVHNLVERCRMCTPAALAVAERCFERRYILQDGAARSGTCQPPHSVQAHELCRSPRALSAQEPVASVTYPLAVQRALLAAVMKVRARRRPLKARSVARPTAWFDQCMCIHTSMHAQQQHAQLHPR